MHVLHFELKLMMIESGSACTVVTPSTSSHARILLFNLDHTPRPLYICPPLVHLLIEKSYHFMLNAMVYTVVFRLSESVSSNGGAEA